LLFPAIASWLALAAAAQAAPYLGMAHPWQLGFQTPVTPVMKQLYGMHDFLLIIITAITILVLLLMTFICIRFHRRHNPVPSKTTHNTRLEIIWTAIPILILVAIAIPSLRLHYYMERHEEADLTVKVTGLQWYWHYDYPDHGGFGFDSYIKKDADLKTGDIRQLAVDNMMVVPVDSTVRVLITGADVIHSWAVPAFGVKRDAVPGKLNETWFKADRIGTFYGQCSQLCGVGHGFMPIAVNVVSKEDFNAWVKQKQGESGIVPAVQTQMNQALKPTTPSAPAAATPLAKPEAPAKNETPQIEREEKNSQEKGEGKPADDAKNPETPQDDSDEDKPADDQHQ
ncbi:MAG: cytochrome c oxidase subunit II, partial [Pseudomonadota bacterium]|nr:cytochrome c oxidase subunit II [Pseudomonadota bacterium]